MKPLPVDRDGIDVRREVERMVLARLAGGPVAAIWRQPPNVERATRRLMRRGAVVQFTAPWPGPYVGTCIKRWYALPAAAESTAPRGLPTSTHVEPTP